MLHSRFPAAGRPQPVNVLQKGAGVAATMRTSRRVRGAAPASSGLTDDFREPSDGEHAPAARPACGTQQISPQVFAQELCLPCLGWLCLCIVATPDEPSYASESDEPYVISGESSYGRCLSLWLGSNS